MLEILSWKPEFSMKVSEIDEQHKKIIELINLLHSDAYTGSYKQGCADILKQLYNYCDYHFSTEEKYFHHFNYLGTEEHENEHRLYRKNVIGFESRLEKISSDYDIGKFASELLNFLHDWWEHHILYIDKKYVNCFNENGLF